MNSTLLDIRNLKTYFYLDEGEVRAVDDVTVRIERGRVLGVVGESGCGKSVLARSIMRIVRPPGRTVDGEIIYYRPSPNGGDEYEGIDLQQLPQDGEVMRRIRGADITMVFQEPMVSFSRCIRLATRLSKAYCCIRMFLRRRRERSPPIRWERWGYRILTSV